MTEEESVLAATIAQLSKTPPVSRTQAERLTKAARFDFFRDYKQSDVDKHLQQWRPRLFDGGITPEAIKANKDNLVWQLRMIDRAFSDWIERGHTMPPYYANRVVTILRKQKNLDGERAFLAAYVPHIRQHASGKTDAALIERADKLGL